MTFPFQVVTHDPIKILGQFFFDVVDAFGGTGFDLVQQDIGSVHKALKVLLSKVSTFLFIPGPMI